MKITINFQRITQGICEKNSKICPTIFMKILILDLTRTVGYIFRSFVQHYHLVLCASLKSREKYHFPQENAVCAVTCVYFFCGFPRCPFFILNYSFDTNFGNPAVESSRTIYQALLVFFVTLSFFFFLWLFARHRLSSIFFFLFFFT